MKHVTYQISRLFCSTLFCELNIIAIDQFKIKYIGLPISKAKMNYNYNYLDLNFYF